MGFSTGIDTWASQLDIAFGLRDLYTMDVIMHAERMEAMLLIKKDGKVVKKISYLPIEENSKQVMEIANEFITKQKEEDEALRTLGE